VGVCEPVVIGSVAGLSEHGNEPSGSINVRKCMKLLNEY
jgi:hypothetical protein